MDSVKNCHIFGNYVKFKQICAKETSVNNSFFMNWCPFLKQCVSVEKQFQEWNSMSLFSFVASEIHKLIFCPQLLLSRIFRWILSFYRSPSSNSSSSNFRTGGWKLLIIKTTPKHVQHTFLWLMATVMIAKHLTNR